MGKALLQSDRNATLFSEVRVDNRESYVCHQEYIAQNPVRKGLVDSPEEFPYCFTYLAERKRAGAKAQS